ncbi:MAG TPA: glycosyltransferase family 2 protein [Candidatus Hydrogenedens sp.]|nr:glycosyltransferase family 2 protein [Candidatus Hydrogenedens sp.]
MKLSFVIPAYNEEMTIKPLVEGIIEHTSPHDVQIILIDDGSTDSTFQSMLKVQSEHPQVKIIKFRRNFGKSRALSAGFHEADGDIIIMMDADLQDDPKEIPRMIEKMQEGYDVVCGWKKRRLDPWHKTFPSKIYNAIIRYLFHVNLHDINTGFKAFRKEVVPYIPLYGEMHRLIAISASELGFKVTEIPVEHHPRKYGKSKFGFSRFFFGAVDVYTVWFLSRHSQSPSYFFTKRGLMAIGLGILCLLGGLSGFYLDGEQLHYVFLGTVGSVFVGIGFLTIGTGLIAEILRREFAMKQDFSIIECVLSTKNSNLNPKD